MGRIFDVGTLGRECKVVKAETWGPKGWNGGTRVSDVNVDLLVEGVWELMTTRVCGTVEAIFVD
jgi:hypothetical protein